MKLFEKGELKVLWPFYLNELIEYSFYIWIGFYVIYFKEIGLSFFQISLLFAVWSLAKIIFELPTGAIADIFGKKVSVMISYGLYTILLLVLPLVRNFYLLLLIFLLLGLSITFYSGAEEALVVNHLNQNKRKDLLHDYYIKYNSLASLSGIFAGLVGAFTVKYLGLSYIWTITGIMSFVSSLVILFFVKENFKLKKISIINFIKKTYDYSKFSVKYSLNHGVLLYLILASFFVSIYLALTGFMVWQPLLVGLNFKVYWIGYLLSLGGLIALVIPFFSKYILKLFKKEKYYLSFFYFVLFIISILIYFVFNWQFAIIIFLLSLFPWELINPVNSKFFQHHTLTKYRATITSFNSMIDSGGKMIGTLITGILLDLIGPKMTLFYSSFLLIPVIICYILIKERK
ncbi:MAG: MFS transporter [Candidatus Nanoarchaeia archaeon]|nr:MFS transporter [Candidatus Nanoarchaeia archaeon]